MSEHRSFSPGQSAALHQIHERERDNPLFSHVVRRTRRLLAQNPEDLMSIKNTLLAEAHLIAGVRDVIHTLPYLMIALAYPTLYTAIYHLAMSTPYLLRSIPESRKASVG